VSSIDITICEVGPRDGLQSIRQVLPTAAKKAWIEALYRAGVPEIEVGSFVPATLLPQLADTADLVPFATALEGLGVAVLVPNLRGLERAVEAGAHQVTLPFSMSETHSVRNVRKTHPQMLEEIGSCAEFLHEQPDTRRPTFRVALATAFGCTLEGPVPEDRVIRLAASAVELGADQLVLADTTGYGNPAQLKRLARGIRAACGRDKLTGVHLHNTRGQGLANALMAVEIGITRFDASLGGIGGCPYAPGASGNVVTEDLVWLLESMGLRTGIDLDKLLAARDLLQQALPGEPLYGHLAAVKEEKGDGRKKRKKGTEEIKRA
jgi:hydroxymethylglutaryl-CoA lyase